MAIQFDAISRVRELHDYCFWFSATLTGVALPVSVESIGISCFSGCYSIQCVDIAAGSRLRSIESGAFGSLRIAALVLPPSLEVIGKSAFSDCRQLHALEFGGVSRLAEIGPGAFWLSAIGSVKMPRTVRVIGIAAFRDVAALTTVAFEDGTTCERIDDFAFWNTRISLIRLPESLAYVGKRALPRTTRVRGPPSMKEWISKRRTNVDMVFRRDPGLALPAYDPSLDAKLTECRDGCSDLSMISGRRWM
jgi:hypothetical protein